MRNAGERAQDLYDQWADAFSTALENSTSGQTSVDSDVQNQARNTDSQGNKLTEAQQEYFKDSKVRDKDGNLLDVTFESNQSKNTTNTNTNTNPTADPDIRFCARDNSPNEFNPNGETLEEQLKDALETAQSFEGRYVYVGKFTKEFVDKLKKHIDIKNYPIVMNYRDAYLSMEAKERGKYQGSRINYHNLGVEGLEAALMSFNDPEYVLLSATKGKIELVLQGRDYKNRQLFSIVEVNTKTQNNRKFLDVHVVTSVYGNRGLANRIAVANQEKRVIYKKQEEPTQGIPQVQYKRDINVSSSADSIPQESSSVKENISDTQAQARRVTKEQDTAYIDAVNRGDTETARRERTDI